MVDDFLSVGIYDSRGCCGICVDKICIRICGVIRSFKVTVTKRCLDGIKRWNTPAVSFQFPAAFLICRLDRSLYLCDSLFIALWYDQTDTVLRSPSVDCLRLP